MSILLLQYYYCSLRLHFKVKVHLSFADTVDGKRASKFATIFIEYV